MTRAYARTIGPRIRISRRDGASARCSGSNRPDQPNASCPFTPPSKTLSTSSAISHPATRTASSETKLSGRGELRQPHELELGRPDFPRPIQVHGTERLVEIQAYRRDHNSAYGPSEILTIVRVIVSPDNPNHALRLLKMAVKVYPYQPYARIKLEPWLALDRLGDRRLDAMQQATVVAAKRTPRKVRWPDWWEHSSPRKHAGRSETLQGGVRSGYSTVVFCQAEARFRSSNRRSFQVSVSRTWRLTTTRGSRPC